jgi:hypothetical protein
MRVARESATFTNVGDATNPISATNGAVSIWTDNGEGGDVTVVLQVRAPGGTSGDWSEIVGGPTIEAKGFVTYGPIWGDWEIRLVATNATSGSVNGILQVAQ